ncbi:MAG: threonylcarbamoyl-AMP synthase [Clostridia bacterium]|nr:threonylcarbamoyl-AMP synthase [Clostridia bacterium]
MNTKLFTEPTETAVTEAAEILRSGGLVAFPTETVYGLGGNGLDPDAARKIYAAKGRPSDNPLIIHVAEIADAERYCITSPLYYKIAEHFMPGPITVIMPKRDCIPYEVTGGLDTVALRIPSHPIAHRLLAEAKIPVAAPSANLSGRPSPTTAAHVITDMMGRINAIIDGGDCDFGVESTIVKIDGKHVTLLRPGAVTLEELRELCGEVAVDPTITEKPAENFIPLAPGMKYRHYAPRAHVTLLDGSHDAVTACLTEAVNHEDIGILCYDDMLPEALTSRSNVITLGKESDPTETAHKLFAALRAFDDMQQVTSILAPLPDKKGIGLAVYNRLIKAAGFDVKKI